MKCMHVIWCCSFIIYITLPVSVGVLSNSVSGVTLDNDGRYQGLSVSIGENVNEADCEAIVDKLIILLQDSSNYIINASNNKVSFGPSVDIVVPNTWTSCGKYDSKFVFAPRTLTDTTLRVDLTHPIFGDEIWTQQPGHCGEPGDFIYIPKHWLDTTTQYQGRRLVQEWAKLRWGVFEEHGHVGDPIYPPAYRDVNNDLVPNYCSDHAIVADMSGCSDEISCNVAIHQQDNLNIKSSLMAFHDLFSVDKFCTSSNHLDLPNKHNIICGGKSVLTVMQEHSDFNRTTQVTTSVTIEPKLVKAAKVQPVKLSIVIDHSRLMNMKTDEFNFLQDAVEQLIDVEMDEVTSVSLVQFSSSSSKLADMSYVWSARAELVTRVDNIDSETHEGTKNLVPALTTASSTFINGEIGTILLITENTSPYNGAQDVNAMVEAAGKHRVDVLLYPHTSTIQSNIYDQLTSLTGGVTYKVPDRVSNSRQDPVSRRALSQSLRNINYGSPYVTIGQDACLGAANVCEMTTINIDSSYTQLYTVLYHYSDSPINTTVSTSDGNRCTLEEHKSIASAFYKCPNMQSGTIRILVMKGRNDDPVYYEVIGIPSHETSNSTSNEISVWFSQDSNNLAYSAEKVPVIFAQIRHNNRHVIHASVSADLSTPLYPSMQNTIELKDTGTGGDVTGQDGIYSAYLLNIPKTFLGLLNVQINANDSSGAAKYLPNKPGVVSECCGSELKLDPNLDPTGTFQLSSESVNSIITVSPAADYPPAQITDLRASHNNNLRVTLSFTAPGAMLDFGTCTSYTVKLYTGTINGSEVSGLENISPKPAGSSETISFTSSHCDTIVTYTVTSASDTSTSMPSNPSRIYISCRSSNSLSSGAITGIVFGCLIAVLIVIFLVCLCLTRDEKEDSLYWHCALCKCISNKNKSKPEISSPQNVPQQRPVTMIRNISDLYATPSKSNNHNEARQNQAYDSDNDDGGFKRPMNVVTSRYVEDSSSRASSSHHLQHNYPVTQQQAPSTASSMSDLSQRHAVQTHVRSSFDYYPSYHATPRPVIEEPGPPNKSNYQYNRHYSGQNHLNQPMQRHNTQV